jgi:hypothetical protein
MDIEDIFHAIDAVRTDQAAQHAACLVVLTEIRDGLRELVQALQEPLPEPQAAPCTHPQGQRTDDNPGARFWKCKACGFIYDSERTV